mgnify:CR=1 FL=1
MPFSGYGFRQQDTQLVRIIQRSAHGTRASIWGELPEEHTSCARVGHIDKSERLSAGCQAKIPLSVPFPVTDPFKVLLSISAVMGMTSCSSMICDMLPCTGRKSPGRRKPVRHILLRRSKSQTSKPSLPHKVV